MALRKKNTMFYERERFWSAKCWFCWMPYSSTMVSTNPRNYGPFPHFSKPQEVDSFSCYPKRRIEFDKRQLKWLYLGPLKNRGRKEKESVNFDLNVGFEAWNPRCEEEDKKFLIPFYRWVVQIDVSASASAATNAKAAFHEADFVCWRGLLTRLGATPYENRDGWIIACVRFADVIFMYEYDTEEKLEKMEARTAKELRMTYWGHKFEEYMVLDGASQVGPPIVSSDAAKNEEQFCTLMKSRLGKHRLFFGAEVDCTIAGCGAGEYVELKTNRRIENAKQMRNFHRFKALKWWLQSFLVGIENIVCGYRDDHGFVKQVEWRNVTKLEKESREFWSGAVCFGFIDAILTYVKSSLTENDAEKVFLMEWSPGQRNITLRRATSDECRQYKIVPDWFVRGEAEAC